MAIEPRWSFYPKYWWELLTTHVRWAGIFLRMIPHGYCIKWDKKRRDYMDLSLTPVDTDNLEDMQIVSETRGGTAALERTRVIKQSSSAAQGAA